MSTENSFSRSQELAIMDMETFKVGDPYEKDADTSLDDENLGKIRKLEDSLLTWAVETHGYVLISS
jgi:hypothetical protein